MKNASDISQDHARLLMSQLLDGELAAPDAALLERYLEKHPDAQDWMENLDLARETQHPNLISAGHTASITSIQDAISKTDKAAAVADEKSVLLSFPAFIRSMAAAAAVAIVGTVTWMGLHSEAHAHYEPNVVEFVATDLPGASTYIFPDEETGWTVVWVDSDPVNAEAKKG
jgi:anti-sigma factor RsiW